MGFPRALPDETLYSRLIRYQMLTGLNPETLAINFFGRKRVSIHPFLTIGANRVAELAKEDVNSILKNQTLGHFFAFFLPKYKKQIFSKLLQDDAAAAFRACQLSNFKNNEPPLIKYCPDCAKEDIQNHGVSYWHLFHQIPGIDTCPHHSLDLIKVNCSENRTFPAYFLPDPSQKSEDSSYESSEFAGYVKTYFARILSTESYSIESLKERIRHSGYGLGNSRFQTGRLCKDLHLFSQCLNNTSASLLISSPMEVRYLFFLLKGGVSQHPIKYLLLEFLLSRVIEHSEPVIKVRNEAKSIAEENIEEKCVKLLNKGLSLSEISKITGKSRCYLRGLAYKRNIELESRPKKVTPEYRAIILMLAARGFHRKCIAERLCISTGSVEQVISSVPELVERRKRMKYESKRRRYKLQILRSVEANPQAIKQEIRNACPNAFYWLYRNEKEWLNKTMPLALKPSPPRKMQLK